MSEQNDPRIFSPDGRLIGQVMIAEDGSGAVAVDLDGNIVDAVDENMNPVDPAEFTINYDDDAAAAEHDDPRLAELQESMAALEDRIANPGPTPEYRQGPDPGEVWGSVVGRELENLETDLGRKLTEAEAYRILEDHKADFDSGVQPNIYKSAANANLADDSTHEGRVARATELLADAGRPEDEVYSPEAKPSRESYNLDVPEERHQWMADRMAGADVDDLRYSGSQQEEGTDGASE